MDGEALAGGSCCHRAGPPTSAGGTASCGSFLGELPHACFMSSVSAGFPPRVGARFTFLGCLVAVPFGAGMST